MSEERIDISLLVEKKLLRFRIRTNNYFRGYGTTAMTRATPSFMPIVLTRFKQTSREMLPGMTPRVIVITCNGFSRTRWVLCIGDILCGILRASKMIFRDSEM